MAYNLTGITIRTNNHADGLKKIEELWGDITSGKLPLLFDSEHNFLAGISPVSSYSNYETDENGDYDLSILGVTAEFFARMEEAAGKGLYKKYDVSDDNGDIGQCARNAWQMVWDEQTSGVIRRTYTTDYESTVPAEYTKDGKAHCYLYIAVQSCNRTGT